MVIVEEIKNEYHKENTVARTNCETWLKRRNKMNETLKVMETRRSCRNFDPEKAVSEADIQAIVKAGTYAASGMGKQSPIILAVSN